MCVNITNQNLLNEILNSNSRQITLEMLTIWIPQWSSLTVSHRGPTTSSSSIHKVGASAVPIWHGKPETFLRSCWYLVHDESLETLVLASVKESSTAATEQTNLAARGKPKARGSSFCSVLFHLSCCQRAPPLWVFPHESSQSGQ